MQEETSEQDESVAVDGMDVLENETERDPLNGFIAAVLKDNPTVSAALSDPVFVLHVGLIALVGAVARPPELQVFGPEETRERREDLKSGSVPFRGGVLPS
ncbi:unnamed protein product [Pleuronectes platessa]|uniref:Uncharacterized protein n=1 Tax=Pleuronectes platessa TaxID=8262 RepID=A0A9N7Z9Z9_PLEPL|nr:unnamed protein product [Pleuronectes platessa]